MRSSPHAVGPSPGSVREAVDIDLGSTCEAGCECLESQQQQATLANRAPTVYVQIFIYMYVYLYIRTS